MSAALDELFYRFVEQEETPDEETMEIIIGALGKQHRALTDAALLIGALAVFGDGVNLGAAVERAQAIHEDLGDALCAVERMELPVTS